MVFLAGFSHPVYGDKNSNEQKDEEYEHPKRLKDKKWHDWIISAPGLLINLPLKIICKGVGNAAGYIDETRLAVRIKDFLTSDDGLRALRPTYSSRGGAGLKVYQKNLVNKGSKLELLAAGGLRFRQKYQLTFKRFELVNDKIFSRFQVGYLKQPDESFFGIGPHTSKCKKSNFDHEFSSASAEFGAKLFGALDLATLFSMENNTILKGKDDALPSTTDQYDLSTLPGLESEVRLMSIGLALRFDSRNTSTGMTNGQELIINGSFFDQLDGEEYAFWKLTADLKQHIHLFYERALMLRLAGEMTEPATSKAVPFYKLSELGRGETIRGFSRGRFRDLDMLLASIEYKYPIWRHHDHKVMSFLFLDAGQVAGDIFRDIRSDDIQFGFGGGISYSDSDGEALRILLGKSKEQFRLYAVLN